MPFSPLGQRLNGGDDPNAPLLPGETEEERRKRLQGIYAMQNRANAMLTGNANGMAGGLKMSPFYTGQRGY